MVSHDDLTDDLQDDLIQQSSMRYILQEPLCISLRLEKRRRDM